MNKMKCKLLFSNRNYRGEIIVSRFHPYTIYAVIGGNNDITYLKRVSKSDKLEIEEYVKNLNS